MENVSPLETIVSSINSMSLVKSINKINILDDPNYFPFVFNILFFLNS